MTSCRLFPTLPCLRFPYLRKKRNPQISCCTYKFPLTCSQKWLLAEAWNSSFDQDDSHTGDPQPALSQNVSSLSWWCSYNSALYLASGRHSTNPSWAEKDCSNSGSWSSVPKLPESTQQSHGSVNLSRTLCRPLQLRSCSWYTQGCRVWASHPRSPVHMDLSFTSFCRNELLAYSLSR